MTRIQLTLACGSYDRTIPLQDGTVVPNGIDLNFVPMRPTELFRRQARHAEFDIAEFSFSTYTILHSRGDVRMIAIPVFPSRKFRHGHIFVNGDAIGEPSELAGKRIGNPEFQNTATTWIRGILEEQYGVATAGVKWFSGGLNAPKTEGDRIPVTVGSGIVVEPVPQGRYLSEMLESESIDALICANVPDSFGTPGSSIRRLIPDYVDVEKEYFRRTQIFPIMHTVVIKREIYERHPWVARNLREAFEEAKRIGRTRLEYPAALYCSVPWLIEHIEEMDALSGGRDLFAYGIEPNRHVLETFLAYSLGQGLIDRELTVDELFAVEAR
jgi:4,5-dihydroxyphthalate decarboxylase